MPISTNAGKPKRSNRRARLPGVFRWLVDRERQAVAEIDERAERIQGKLADSPELQYVLDVDTRQREAIVRRIAEMESGEPQLVHVSDMRKFSGAEKVPFLAPIDLYEVTSDEYAETAWSVRVYPTDHVEVGQTRAQAQRKSELVSDGYHHGRITDDGDYQPTALNPETGEWQDIGPGVRRRVVVSADDTVRPI
jgi:hypothetical protein